MGPHTYEHMPHAWLRSRLRRMAVAMATFALILSLGAPTTTAVGFGQWHRDNYGTGHERLTCIEGTHDWQCYYENADFASTTGHFNGRNVSDSWVCPDWFSPEICDPDNRVAVYRGDNIYIPRPGLKADQPDRIPQDYVLTSIDGQAILFLFWRESGVGPFYCPWFRTFQEALDAPFECTFRDGSPF